jgi:high-affinity Fe2+/Pb2+ permease
MSTPICCHNQSSFLRRALGVWQWLLPTAILALLPKCPACLAGYVLIWTGVGLSLSTAGVVRTTLLVLSIAMLVFLAARALRTLIHVSNRNKETQP